MTNQSSATSFPFPGNEVGISVEPRHQNGNFSDQIKSARRDTAAYDAKLKEAKRLYIFLLASDKSLTFKITTDEWLAFI